MNINEAVLSSCMGVEQSVACFRVVNKLITPQLPVSVCINLNRCHPPIALRTPDEERRENLPRHRHPWQHGPLNIAEDGFTTALNIWHMSKNNLDGLVLTFNSA